MKIEFNNEKPLILDGGMGQTLLKQGVISQGTLWSASALLDGSLHQMVINAHQEFMKAGAKVITTNNFAVRKLRFSENNILDKFEEAMHNAEWVMKYYGIERDITDGAIMYHAYYSNPYWSLHYTRTSRIESHIFYK